MDKESGRGKKHPNSCKADAFLASSFPNLKFNLKTQIMQRYRKDH